MSWGSGRKLAVGERIYIKPFGQVIIGKLWMPMGHRDQLIEIRGFPGVFYSWKKISPYQGFEAARHKALEKVDEATFFDRREATFLYEMILQHPCCSVPTSVKRKLGKIIGNDISLLAEQGVKDSPCPGGHLEAI